MADTLVRITSRQSGLSDFLAACTDRINLIDGYLARVVRQDYINAQRDRFNNENAGDDFLGKKWTLDPLYVKYKKKKYADFPGAGEKVNVARGNLLSSLILDGTYYPDSAPQGKKIKAGRKGKKSSGQESAGFLSVIESNAIHIYTLVPYAQFVDEKRTFTRWSPVFWNRINQGILKYLTGKGPV